MNMTNHKVAVQLNSCVSILMYLIKISRITL